MTASINPALQLLEIWSLEIGEPFLFCPGGGLYAEITNFQIPEVNVSHFPQEIHCKHNQTGGQSSLNVLNNVVQKGIQIGLILEISDDLMRSHVQPGGLEKIEQRRCATLVGREDRSFVERGKSPAVELYVRRRRGFYGFRCTNLMESLYMLSKKILSEANIDKSKTLMSSALQKVFQRVVFLSLLSVFSHRSWFVLKGENGLANVKNQVVLMNRGERLYLFWQLAHQWLSSFQKLYQQGKTMVSRTLIQNEKTCSHRLFLLLTLPSSTIRQFPLFSSKDSSQQNSIKYRSYFHTILIGQAPDHFTLVSVLVLPNGVGQDCGLHSQFFP